MIWTKRPSSQFSSDSFRSDNLVGFGLGATGNGIGRLGLKRELLACDDSLEKKPHGGSETDKSLSLGGWRLLTIFSRQFGRVYWGRKILLAKEIQHDLIEEQAMGVIC